MPQSARPRKLAESDAILSYNLSRRARKPVVIDALKSYRATIPPARFKHLNVDEEYQRVRITGWINDLIQAIKAGGSIPAPISLAERPDGSLWIVDGQQRFWAASECGVPVEATIYKVPDPIADNYATERKLFYILNRSRALSSVTRVGGWAGHATTLLHKVGETESYAQHRIGFKHAGSSTYNAAVLARGLVALMSDAVNPATRGIDDVLRISETVLGNADARQKAETFLHLVPRVFPQPADARFLAVLALARVAAKRWAKKVVIPDATVLRNLGRVNVAKLTNNSAATRFLPLVESAYEARWR